MTNTITLTPHECFPVPCVSPRMYRKEVLSLCVFFFPRLPSRRRSSHARINDNNTVIHNATTDRINKQTRDHPTDTARERLRDVCYLRTTTRTGRCDSASLVPVPHTETFTGAPSPSRLSSHTSIYGFTLAFWCDGLPFASIVCWQMPTACIYEFTYMYT